MKKIIILLAIVGALIATKYWYYSDEKIIIRKSHSLLNCFDKEDGDGLLSNPLGEDTFRDLLDKKVTLNFEHRDMPDMKGGIPQERSKLARSYLYAMKSAKSVKMTEETVELISIEDKSAKVKVTVHGEVKHSKYSLDSDMTLYLDFKDTDEGWRISGITVKRSD